MFHRPPKKYSEYLVNVEQSIDWILKTLWKLKKGEFTQNLQEVTDEGNTTTNIIDTAGTKSDYFQLDTAATPTLLPGMFGWNDSDGTANLRLKGNNVTLQVGQETVARVVNKTGANLLESQYKVVRVRIASEGGSQGQRLAVVLAQGDSDPDSATTLGLVTENIANNQEGFITIFGNVNGINTTGSLQGEAWVDGDVLYLSPTISGDLTKVKPIAPQHTVIVGYVLYAHNNQGKIFVKVDNGYELDELHNVRITSVANSDLLQYDSTLQVWKNVAASVAVPTPTLAQVTTAGNTTTNAITVGKVITGGSITAASLLAQGVYFNNTLVAAANNDVLVGLDINPTFTTGAFTGVSNIAARVMGNLISQYASARITATPTSNTQSHGFNSLYSGEERMFVGYIGNSTLYGTTLSAYFGSPAGYKISFGTVNTIHQTIFTNGNVAIGTTTDAGYKLDVNGTARVQGNLFAVRVYSKVFREPDSDSTYLLVNWSGYTNNQITFGTPQTTALTLNAKSTGYTTIPNGNVLIGTTTDAGYKLDVNGTARVKGTGTTSATSAFTVQNSGGTNGLNVQDDGKVTVGRTAGAYIEVGSLSNFHNTSAGYDHVFRSGGSQIVRIIAAGGIFIGSGSVNASSVLQADSTTKGFLPPRMTTTEKNAIATPAAGLVVYDTTDNKHYGYNGTTWNAFY